LNHEHCSSLIQVQQYLQRLFQPCGATTTGKNSRHGPNGHLIHPPHKTHSTRFIATATLDNAAATDATATAKTSAGSQDAIVGVGGYSEFPL
jgi:hypothetical protein